MEDREMTLEEWCKKLPKHHLVNRQLLELRANLYEANCELAKQIRINKELETILRITEEWLTQENL